jgi:hypothetical protein
MGTEYAFDVDSEIVFSLSLSLSFSLSLSLSLFITHVDDKRPSTLPEFSVVLIFHFNGYVKFLLRTQRGNTPAELSSLWEGGGGRFISLSSISISTQRPG